jgi:tartrate/fumarate subfamily iron-sulfur-dependent hydro-lyase beta chain
MREVELSTPISEKAARNLRAGDVVYLTGKKIFVIPFTVSAEPVLESIDKGKPLFDLPGSVIYHTPFGFREEDGEWKVRWVGATTSSMTESWAPRLLDLGVRALIGKGGMGQVALESMQKNGAVYLATTGGSAAIYARGVKGIVEMVDPSLFLAELEFEHFGPAIVALDSHGKNLFDDNWNAARKKAAELISGKKTQSSLSGYRISSDTPR